MKVLELAVPYSTILCVYYIIISKHFHAMKGGARWNYLFKKTSYSEYFNVLAD